MKMERGVILELLDNIDTFVDTDDYKEDGEWDKGYEDLFNIVMEHGDRLNVFEDEDKEDSDYDIIINVDNKRYGFVELHGQGSYCCIEVIDEKIGGDSIDINDVFNLCYDGCFPNSVLAMKVLEKGIKAMVTVVGGYDINIEGSVVNLLDVKKYIKNKIIK